MTGGQDVDGQMAVPELARCLQAEGVTRIIITTDDPSRYDGVGCPRWPRCATAHALLEAQQELARIPGVTVLIHDQAVRGRAAPARASAEGGRPAEQV